MDERPSNPLLARGVLIAGRGVGEERGRREGAANPGGVRATISEDWRCDEVGGDGGELTGDRARREVVVQCVYGV